MWRLKVHDGARKPTGGRPNARIGDRTSDPQVRLVDHPPTRYSPTSLEAIS